MKFAYTVQDDFCEHAPGVRASFLESGFGKWTPNKGEVGSSVYEGMNWQGGHGVMLRALSKVFGGLPIFPNSIFARITTPSMERAYIHSDREMGSYTCIAYLSEHMETYGTAFYCHRATGLREMPSFEEMQKYGIMNPLKEDMVQGGEEEWEQMDFVRGKFNRAVVFHAPLFHARIPLLGIGDDERPETARMVWVAHFDLP